jgi:hypothetical protein
MKKVLNDKPTLLLIILFGFFVTNALVAEFIGVKIFALEPTLGMKNFEWKLFGQNGTLTLTAGVILWPVVFVMTDIINEYYGKRAVKLMSYITAVLISYAFIMVYFAIQLVPAEWWVTVYENVGVPDMQVAFAQVFGQGLWIIGGSLIAFLFGQVIDAGVFKRLRTYTGEQKVWLRATGSTLISQFIDSFVVLYVAFVLGPQKWSLELFLAVGMVNYTYKFAVAILLTPVIYLAHLIIDRFLGAAQAAEMKLQASSA